MAIIYSKGKGVKRTGVDKVTHKFGSTLEKIKSGAKRVATRPKRALNAKKQGDAQKELKNIERAFGSVDKYVELNPTFRKRADELKKLAGR